MSTLSWLKMPFKYSGENDFFQQLDNWTGDLFYERLPDLGYEIREEQIYTTFHIIKALRERKVLFAEAGSGTGKTFAYLLACLCYARLKGKPVILSLSSPILQEQLMSPKGDIATLSRQLNLDIDARVAKRQEHYACEIKLENLEWADDHPEKAILLEWSGRSLSGERSEIPDIGDDAWAQVAWDHTLPCNNCSQRSGCRQVRSRRDFREARDFIICEHEVFFKDLWLREELQFRGWQTYLPEYAAVVFDEAHLIELPLAKTLGRQLSEKKLKIIFKSITSVNDQRLIVTEKVNKTDKAARAFFRELKGSVLIDEHADRMHVRFNDRLLKAADGLVGTIDVLQDELVIEESMNEGTPLEFALASYQEQLDQYRQGLKLLMEGEEHSVTWWEPKESASWVIPREFSHALREELLVKRLPVIFTSATLAVGQDFTYMQQITGAQQPIHAQVGVPFDLEEQVAAYVALDLPLGEGFMANVVSRIEELINITQGRTLILCSSVADVQQLRQAMGQRKMPYPFLWEGDAHRAKLVDDFRNDISSVLVGSELWEGVDVPGEALSQVIIVTLPFPRHDPLIEARRRDAQEDGLDPFTAIDVPSMLIKLRQGFGRLVRTATDRGLISILDSRPRSETHQIVLEAIPKGVPVTSDLNEAAKRARKILG